MGHLVLRLNAGCADQVHHVAGVVELGQLGPDQVPVIRPQIAAGDLPFSSTFNLNAELWTWLSTILPSRELAEVHGRDAYGGR